MKKIYVYCCSILFASSITAQVPSFDFESPWVVTGGGPANPVGWTSTNVLVAFGNDTTIHQASSPDVNGGAKAMKIETIRLATNPGTSSGIPDTSCFALTGKITIIPASLKSGYATATRSDKLDFFYKYIPVAGDSGSIGMFLTKWTGTSRDTVATGTMHLGAQASFVSKSLLLNYRPAYYASGNPDTAMIYFGSSNIKSIVVNAGTMTAKFNSPKIGSILWVDDISLSYVGVKEIKLTEKISYYPNPSNEFLNFNFENTSERTILIFDWSGKLISENIVKEKSACIKTNEYMNGIYYFKIKNYSNEIIAAEKFILIK